MTIQHAPSDCWRRHLKGLAIRFSNLSSHSVTTGEATDGISGLSLSASSSQSAIPKNNTLGRADNCPRFSDQCKGRAELL